MKKASAKQEPKLGKGARTRIKLMEAALGVFAREGFEAASVNEIARAADVVNGTFYLHFKDKNDIATAVTFGLAADVTRQLEEAMTGIDDAVERTGTATRRFIELASAQSDWGWTLWRANWFFSGLREGAAARLRADLMRGYEQGVFTVEIDNFLISIFTSMMSAALFDRLRGAAGPEAGSKVAELQLRMLGVPQEKAKAAAWRDLPPLDIALRIQSV